MLRITDVDPLDGHKLKLRLTDGSVIERDVSRLLTGRLFEAIRSDPQLFGQVFATDGSVAWPNGADLCPDVLIYGGAPAEDAELAASKAAVG